jgi:hypothetical protein
MNLQELRQLYHEKKLTDAELKKREEIAQAIAKEHPEMEMSKKMAIATAQAKKVAEEFDSLEEASNYDLVVNYYRHLGLDPYKLRGIVGKGLRDKIKASPAFKFSCYYIIIADDFALVNEVYGSYFNDDYPARETLAVKTLPKNVNVEISFIAIFS